MASTRLTIVRDRTVNLAFDLHRTIAATDTIYFAMKNDKGQDFYDIEPIECTITNATLGLFSLEITNDLTTNLDVGKYYGELVRVTAAGVYQTLHTYDIDLFAEIINSRDI
jgi:hypothetical protein